MMRLGRQVKVIYLFFIFLRHSQLFEIENLDHNFFGNLLLQFKNLYN